MKHFIGNVLKRYVTYYKKLSNNKFETAAFLLASSFIVLFSLFLYLEIPGFLFGWQDLVTDRYMHERVPSDQIVIIGIDDKSLEELGAWPWNRKYFAQLLETIDTEKPRVIGFDIIFAESREGDTAFENSIENSQTPLVFASKIAGKGEVVPLDYISQNATHGFVNFPSDIDGKVRNVIITKKLQNECRVNLSFEVLSQYFGRANNLQCNKEKVTFGFTTINTEDNVMRIHYVGPAKSFQQISFRDVVNGEYEKGLFKDKIVLIGSVVQEIDDNLINPYDGNLISGVEIQANVINTVLQNQLLYPVNKHIQIFFLVILSCIIYILTFRARTEYSLGFVIFVLIMYVLLSLILFEGGWIIDVLIFPIVFIITWSIVFLCKQIKKNKKSAELKKAFSRYVNEDVLDQILLDPNNLTLGGQSKNMTVLFSDIRRFTTISEQLNTRTLISVMNDYYTHITKDIFANKGTLDKYMGDDVMAFWNAPTDDPLHAYHACKTALAMLHTLKRFNTKHKNKKTFVTFKIGIGINSGKIVVGNVGSETRYDYTILGDQVNLASRLEGLTKRYGVHIVLGYGTVQALKTTGKYDNFTIRLLDLVRVKGKRKAVAIYELMGLAEQKHISLKEAYEEAFSAYIANQFTKAFTLFDKIEDKYSDTASSLLKKRCNDFQNRGSNFMWNGEWSWDIK